MKMKTLFCAMIRTGYNTRTVWNGSCILIRQHKVCCIIRVGTKKMTKMDFHEILPLDQFKCESKEFLSYFYVEFLVFTRQLI